MLKVLLYFVLLGLIVAEDPSNYIIGGRDAELGQFPHMVSIRMQTQNGIFHGCGGGIITNTWVITAAHCIQSGMERYVVAGAVRLQDEGERYDIVRSIPHPDYRFTESNWHDIGLVKTTAIRFHRFVQPIPLNRRNIIRPTPAVLSGFGHSSLDLEVIQSTDRLQYKNTTILTNFDCAARTAITGVFVPEYRPIIYPGHICTLVQRGIGGCFGDSGSALIANGGVVGVVSFGLSCARGAPDILARVSHYSRWLDRQMRD